MEVNASGCVPFWETLLIVTARVCVAAYVCVRVVSLVSRTSQCVKEDVSCVRVCAYAYSLAGLCSYAFRMGLGCFVSQHL